MADRAPDRRVTVQETELLPDDPVRTRRQKIARVTLDSMIQFVGLLDAEGTVLEINQVALDGVGLTLAEVEGKPFWTTFWWQVSPEINDKLRASIRRAAAGELVRWDAEIYGRAGGKETIIIDASLSPVRDEEGNVVFICAEGRDITEKKAQELEIAQKNVELQGLLERIRQLDEIKTQFFANVSHELRTPLALILGPAQRLIDDTGDDTGGMSLPQRRESAQVIARNARMLLKHVNDLLDMSRLEARKLKLEVQELDVAALVRFVASHFAVIADERRLDFTVEADESLTAPVDAEKLQRVLMNLLGNAFKFVPAGGRIRCALRHTAQELVISVDDSGPGVPREQRQAIFERFRQGEGGINRKAGGTGLGLAIAKEFVEMHQGRIEVQESPLGGARFAVTLPRQRLAEGSAPHAVVDAAAVVAAPVAPVAVAVASRSGEHASVARTMLDAVVEELRFSIPASAERPALAASTASAPSPAPTARPRVLVVEDNPDMNRFVVQCLSSHYDVDSAFDGREGLQKARHFRPALVVSDIMMPVVSGVEMIAEMRKVPELQAMPILLLSAKADEELMIQLLNDGAQDFIVKPFSERELVVRVRNLVAAELTRAQVSGLRDVAESASRAKDEFLAMLGHELRNPLSPILSALQLMEMKGDTSFARERTVIERQVSHLTRLIDDLLDVARFARGKIDLKTEVVELAEVVSKAIEQAMPLVEQRGHTLTVDVPASGLRVEGDPIRLSQVVSNLLTNAAKYTPPGGTITVRAHRESVESGDSTLVLAVRDTGLGMPATLVPNIFDLFVQARQESDRSQGGLGIGLAIVRSLVEQHGGTVSAHSDGLGQGSEFVVRLPAHQPARTVAAPPALPARTRTAGGGVRVLVVDDNEDGAEMLAAALTRRGYVTQVANDAPSALRVAAGFAPAIAFLDIGLPVMDGYELAAHLRKLPGLADLQMIALTGYGQDSDRQRTKAAGFLHHLVKPVAIEAIEAALAMASPRPSAPS
jgi:PAS domain S-box-containing protein